MMKPVTTITTTRANRLANICIRHLQQRSSSFELENKGWPGYGNRPENVEQKLESFEQKVKAG